jgi:hypothetical protein
MRRQKKHKWTKGIVKSSRLFSRFVFTLFFLKILWIRSKVHVGFWRDAKSNCRPTAKKKKKTFSHYLECVCVCFYREQYTTSTCDSTHSADATYIQKELFEDDRSIYSLNPFFLSISNRYLFFFQEQKPFDLNLALYMTQTFAFQIYIW